LRNVLQELCANVLQAEVVTTSFFSYFFAKILIPGLLLYRFLTKILLKKLTDVDYADDLALTSGTVANESFYIIEKMPSKALDVNVLITEHINFNQQGSIQMR